ARQIGAAGRRRAVDHGDLRNPGRRGPGHVAEYLAALDEQLALAIEVGAAALDQPDAQQLVLHRNALGPEALLQAHRRDRAALDRAVVGRDHAAHAGHEADAGDVAAAERVLAAVVVVHLVAGQRRQLEERRAGIEQSGDPLARGQLAALLELGPAGLAVGPDRGLEGAKALDQREHLRAVLLVAVAAGVEV